MFFMLINPSPKQLKSSYLEKGLIYSHSNVKLYVCKHLHVPTTQHSLMVIDGASVTWIHDAPWINHTLNQVYSSATLL